MDKGQKSKSDSSLLFKFVLVFLMLLIVVLIIGTIREYWHQQDIDNEMATLQAEIERLNLDKQQFLNSVDAYQNEFFIEQEARLKFNLQKPGEKVVVVPIGDVGNLGDIDEKAQGNGATDIVSNIYYNNLRSWWVYFFQVRNENN